MGEPPGVQNIDSEAGIFLEFFKLYGDEKQLEGLRLAAPQEKNA